MAEYIVVIHCIFCFILKPKSLSFTCSHLLSFVFVCCHSLSFVKSLNAIRCHSLPSVVTHYHSLSLNVPLVCLFINDCLYEFINKYKLLYVYQSMTMICTLSQNVSFQKNCHSMLTMKKYLEN